jgi:alkylated DNA repair dioxygenase AlkB
MNTRALRYFSVSSFEHMTTAPKCFVAHFPNFLSTSQSSELFETLKTSIPWRLEEDSFGPQGRLTYYVGNKDAVFHYVGLTLNPNPWPQELTPINVKLEKEIMPIVRKHLHMENNKQQITGCLLNNFEENKGSIVHHCDEVRAHGEIKCVISLSLGGARYFSIRPKLHTMMLKQTPTSEASRDNKITHETLRTTNNVVDIDKEERIVLMNPGSLVVMAGDTQELFEHSIPPMPNAPPRISLTFRTIVEGFEIRKNY